MIPAGLSAALANRKKFVEEQSVVAEGCGAGTGDLRVTGSKFAGFSFVEKSPTGFTGLVNQGATCYLNSLVQALFMLPEFRLALYNWQYDAELHGDEEFCTALQLQRLFASLQLSARGAVPTGGLTKSFGWEGGDAFRQQDVQECMSVIMEHLSVTTAGSQLAEYLASKHQGVAEDYLECCNCHKPRTRHEPFREISVGIKGMETLENALAHYLQPETLEGVECPHCEARHAHVKGLRLRSLPYILPIQLKRFELNMETFTRVKLHDSLAFPSELDVSKYVTDPDAKEGGCIYELMSVFMHTGSAHAGHYFVYIRDGASGRWFNFNDSTVTELSDDFLTAAPPTADPGSAGAKHAIGSPLKSAYMLFYRKKDASNLSSVPVELIPEHLKAWMDADNEKYLSLKKEWEYERSFLHLKVLYGGRPHLVKIHETETVGALTQRVFDAIKADLQKDDPSVSVDRVRLRIFDSIKGILLGPLGDNETVLKTLSDDVLKKTLQVETRQADEPFELYVQEGVLLRVSHFKGESADSESPLTRPVEIAFAEDTKVADVVRACAKKHGVAEPLEHCELLHLRNDTAAVFPKEATIAELGVTAGDSLFIEAFDRSQLAAGALSPLQRYFSTVFNSISIQYNVELVEGDETLDQKKQEGATAKARPMSLLDAIKAKANANASADESSSSDARATLPADQRMTLRELKARLADCVGVPADAFKLRRGKGGPEFKNLDQTLSEASIADGTFIELQRGAPLQPGQFSLKVLLFTEGEAGGEVQTYLGRIAVTGDTQTAALKELVLERFGQQISAATPGGDVGRIRLRKCEQLPSGHEKLTSVLVDGQTLQESFGRLHDGATMAVQPNVVETEFTAEHMLIRVQRWYPQTSQLSTVAEVAVLKLLSYEQFMQLLAEMGAHLKPTGEVDRSTTDESRVEPEERVNEIRAAPLDPSAIRAVKPFTWQLKELPGIPFLNWNKQPQPGSLLSLNPWNLKDGDLILFKDAREPELPVTFENEDVHIPFVPQPREEGFRIYTPEEQRERRKKAEKENEERLKLLEEKMAAVAAALAGRAPGN